MKDLKIPNWLHYHAFSSGRSSSIVRSLLHLMLGYLDLHPSLAREKAKLRNKGYGDERPFLGHLHIPKTGGTYVNNLPYVLNYSHVVVRRDRSDRFVPMGLTTIGKNKIESGFLFSSVRNPLSFFVSYYHHVLGFGKYSNDRHYDFETAQRGFEPLLDSIMSRTEKWPGRNFLFLQIFDQWGNCIVDWINRTEELDRDLKNLAAQFGYTFVPQEKKRVSPKKGAPSDYYLTDMLQRVTTVYSREMALFGYDGFRTTLPMLGTMPLEKERLRYDCLKDELYIDGILFSRTEE